MASWKDLVISVFSCDLPTNYKVLELECNAYILNKEMIYFAIEKKRLLYKIHSK